VYRIHKKQKSSDEVQWKALKLDEPVGDSSLKAYFVDKPSSQPKDQEISVSTHLQTLKNKTVFEASPATEMDILDGITGLKYLFNCSVIR
jgi:hypothetical protein